MARPLVTKYLPPPAPEIRPSDARRWLARYYGPLADFAALGAFPVALVGRADERELAGIGLRCLAGDVTRIAKACARAIDTGRPVPVAFDPEARIGPDEDAAWRALVRRQNRHRARILRAVVRFEARRPHRGVRGVLRAALRARERLARA